MSEQHKGGRKVLAALAAKNRVSLRRGYFIARCACWRHEVSFCNRDFELSSGDVSAKAWQPLADWVSSRVPRR